MAFPALLDACVLIPIKLTDLLLRLAEANTYRPDLYPAQTVRCVRDHVEACRNPAITVGQLLSTLAKTVPRFVAAVQRPLTQDQW